MSVHVDVLVWLSPFDLINRYYETEALLFCVGDNAVCSRQATKESSESRATGDLHGPRNRQEETTPSKVS